MEFKTLIEKIVKKLGDKAKEGNVKNLARCINEEELFSVLREYIFKTDAKTKAFLDSIKDEEVKVKELVKEDMSEADFIRLVHESLCINVNREDSKVKISKHFFTPENDLAIYFTDKNGFESHYRIMVIKTS